MSPSLWTPRPGGSPEDELTPEQADRLQKFVRVRVLIVVGYVIVLLAVLLGTTVVLGRQHPDRHPSPWFLSALIVGLPLLIGGAFLLTLRRMLLPGATRRSIVSGDIKDRRRVVRLVHKGRPIEGEDRAIAQAQVDLVHGQRRLIRFAIPLGIGLLALAAFDHGKQGVFNLALAVLYLVGVVSIWWSARRLERNAAAQGITPTPKPPKP